MLDITLLGTSATMPLPERALTSVLLSCSGRSILFDCGEGTQTAARKARISLMKTDIIAISHYHGDHIFGLPGLMQTMGCLGRTDPLYITGPAGGEETVKALLYLAGAMPYPIYFLSIPDDGISMRAVSPYWPKEARISAFPTNHRVSSQGYAFTLSRPGRFNPDAARALKVPIEKWGALQHGENAENTDGEIIEPSQVLGPERRGLKFVFSGDSAPSPVLTGAASGADVFICDATYGDAEQLDQAEKYGHSTFAQAASAARDAGAAALVLVHFSQMMENPEDYISNATEIFPEAKCGYDGMKISLAFDKA